MKVFGKNVFNELKTNENIRKVFFTKNFKDEEIINYVKNSNIAYEFVDNNRLDKMVEGNHQGIVIDVNDYEYYNYKDFLTDDFIVILDHLEDPHNFGAIIRTCEAAGIKSIIIPKDRSVRVNSTVMKTSSGALSHIKIAEVSNLVNVINEFKNNNFFVYGSESDGKNYKEVDYADKIVLVIGSEGRGLSRLVRDTCDEIISIPMQGKVNSLNASVAAGILVYGIKK